MSRQFWKFGLTTLASVLFVSTSAAVGGLSNQDRMGEQRMVEERAAQSALHQARSPSDTFTFILVLDPDDTH